MKNIVLTIGLLFTHSIMASITSGIICRDDQRLANGALSEFIITPAQSGYQFQSQFVPSLNSPDIAIDTWATELTCRIDEKSMLAFCHNPKTNDTAQVRERREVFYDSLEEDAKKKTNKYIDISLHDENGVEKKAMSFAASHCQAFGGQA